jgi:SAM-dependent methyltransferase
MDPKGEATMTQPDRDIRAQVRNFYGGFADRQAAPAQEGCCGSGKTIEAAVDPLSQMYAVSDITSLPAEVTNMALGCGDPVTLAALQPGQVVLDLGSGGGIDCFLAAQRVGETGRVIGVDMTAAMVDKARANQAKVGTRNVEFRLGEIEHLPVADNSVDVVISNCVINLSPDKPQVFREAFRVLKPGGLLAVSDIMTDGPLPEAVRASVSAWAGCIGGALEEQDYLSAIEAAGFVDVQITRTTLEPDIADTDLKALGLAEGAKGGQRAIIMVGDHVEVIDLGTSASDAPSVRTFSGKIRARKPNNSG